MLSIQLLLSATIIVNFNIISIILTNVKKIFCFKIIKEKPEKCLIS